MEMKKVESSNIDEIGYSPENRELRVKFKSGAVHDFVGVSPDDHAGLMGADSHGRHFHQNIRGKFANKKAGGAV